MTWQIGSLLWFRGKYAERYSIRGVIEEVKGDQYGVRLENGSFHWATADQFMPRAF